MSKLFEFLELMGHGKYEKSAGYILDTEIKKELSLNNIEGREKSYPNLLKTVNDLQGSSLVAHIIPAVMSFLKNPENEEAIVNDLRDKVRMLEGKGHIIESPKALSREYRITPDKLTEAEKQLPDKIADIAVNGLNRFIALAKEREVKPLGIQNTHAQEITPNREVVIS